MGSYSFKFEYLYRGYNSENMPNIGIPLLTEELTIHGFELKYSKEGYTEAQMRYVQIANNQDCNIDVIVPNGYVLGTKPATDALGIAYTFDTTSEEKVGNVVATEDTDLYLANLSSSQLEFNTTATQGTTTQLNAAGWQLIKDLGFKKTNQGSLWLDTTDTYVQTKDDADDTKDVLGSFYYYSANSNFDVDFTKSGPDFTSQTFPESKEFNNQTTFNTPGYYLVFIRVKTNIKDEESVVGKLCYWQVLSFQYTSDSVNINVEEADDSNPNTVEQVIGAGKFTNKNVTVSWDEAGTFERGVVAKYYYVKNEYLNKTQLLKTAGYPLHNGDVLGNNLAAGEGATYLIELKSEGEAATYRMFTIDREEISGVKLYEVEKVQEVNKTVYNFVITQAGNYKVLSESITDSYASLYWNSKNSGAKIHAKYTYTPIISSNEKPVSLTATNSSLWFTTNYKLWSTVGPFDIGKATSMGSEIAYENVVVRDGIYVYTLTDDAGNTTKYMFVIDSTESYFDVNGEMMCNEALITSNDNINITVATHKVLPLFTLDNILVDYKGVGEFVRLATSGASEIDFANAGYYSQTGTNIQALKNLFARNGNNYYLTVKNEVLETYNSNSVKDESLSKSQISISNNTLIMTYIEDPSTIRTFYLKGANQTSLANIINSKSFVNVEINKDNSRLMAFYSNGNINDISVIPDNFMSKNGVYRLYAGNSLESAHATSDNIVAITWFSGTGDYQVDQVYYHFYPLTAREYDTTSNSFYNDDNPVEFTVFNSATDVAQERMVKALNVLDGKTQPGLYVITRQYKGTEQDFENLGGKDKFAQHYYVIVDRNGVITSDIGEFINIGVLDNDRSYNNFTATGIEMGYTTHSEIEEYPIYLKSNILPASFNVPIAKYMVDNGGDYYLSNYYAGRLIFTLYFVDVNSYFGGQKVIKLFDIEINDLNNAENYRNGYYTVNISEHLTRNQKSIFIQQQNQSNWLCLPGDYVAVIKDTVETGGNKTSHSKVIGFSIPTAIKPSTDVYAVSVNTHDVSQSVAIAEKGGITLETSEEFIKIELPAEDETDFMYADVDINYLIVEQHYKGVSKTLIDYPYAKLGDVDLSINSGFVTNTVVNGKTSRTITLPTYLRKNGVVDVENLTDELYYDITIRYKLYKGNAKEADYLHCYYDYVNGEMITYYETTYKVRIDRIAPKTNVDNLVKNDQLLNYYTNDKDSFFVNSMYTVSNRLQFVYQYNDYYANQKDISYVYALTVNENTPFDFTGINKVYYRSSASLTSINMPVTNLIGFESIDGYMLEGATYSSFAMDDNNYIEIIEEDMAGNMAQYVVYYTELVNTSSSDLTFNLKFNMLKEDDEYSYEPYTFTVPSSEPTKQLTVFDVSTDNNFDFASSNYETKDVFYHFELLNTLTYERKVINTNASTIFDNSNQGLMMKLVNALKDAGQGNYVLKIKSRFAETLTDINYYVEGSKVPLSIESLVEVTNGLYIINLQGANRREDGIMYYAKEIEVIDNSGDRTTYVCNPSRNYGYYIRGREETIINTITNLNGTYQIKLTDAFGKTYGPYRFNTHGIPFYKIQFNGAYSLIDNVYYTLDTTTITYDKAIYTVQVEYNNTVVIGDNFNYYGQKIIEVGYNGVITLNPYKDSIGAMYDIVVKFLNNGLEEFSYNVVMNSRTGAVNLKDITNESQNMDFMFNVNHEDVKPTQTTSGRMVLSWVRNSEENLTYTYTLYEKLKDGSYAEAVFENQNNTSISTESNSEGIYKFVIGIYSNGIYLGNKVFAFSVKEVVNQLYYVQNDDPNMTAALSPNSTFTFKELIETGAYANRLDGKLDIDLDNPPKLKIPLYISNRNLSLVIAKDQGASFEYETIFNESGYEFRIYKVSTSTYSVYCGILKVNGTSNIIKDVKLEYKAEKEDGSGEIEDKIEILQTNKELSYFKSNTVTKNYKLTATQYLNYAAPSSENKNIDSNIFVITKKNYLTLEVYYNNEFVTSDMFATNIDEVNLTSMLSYTIKGSGKYTFIFKDVAGNIHTFELENGDIQQGLEITTLSEIVVKINNKAPIVNGYYNDEIVLTINNPSFYDLASIKLKATRNGEPYNPIKEQYTYIFEEYGVYKVEVEAKYHGAIRKNTVIFTIVNPKEAVESIDLTTIGSYQIDKVENMYGKDITKNFLKVLNATENNEDGRLLTYAEIINNSDELGVMSGKQTFVLTYSVNDGIYPAQTITFAFTMNNEAPTINCSIKPGESTRKSFTISFNPEIVYDQVGEADLYISVGGKDYLIATINEYSTDEIVKQVISERTHGAGSYYVKLQSKSGNIITSFRVVVKEPLNVWAIIIIVVVTVIVAAVIITIVLIRTRMKIR